MADTKVSNLTAATTPDGTELVPVVQGGVSKRTPVSAIRAGDQDSGWLTASGSFAGSVRLIKRGNEISVYGEITRATGFATGFTSIGVTVPAWAHSSTPGVNKQLPGAVATNGGSYQFRVTSAAAVEIRQSQAITQDMSANGSYLIT